MKIWLRIAAGVVAIGGILLALSVPRSCVHSDPNPWIGTYRSACNGTSRLGLIVGAVLIACLILALSERKA